MRSSPLARLGQGTKTVLSWRRFMGRCLVYCPSSVVARALTGPRIPQQIMRRWCDGIVRDVGIEVDAEGLGTIGTRPSVVVANHASLLDVPVLGSALDIDYRWVAKQQLFRVPLVGWHLWACGHIAVDRNKGGNLHRMQEQVEQVLSAGGSVVFFPEGTRSPDGAMRDFRAGAFACAVKAEVPVLPVVLDGTEQLLTKGSLEFPRAANKRVRLRVLDRIVAPAEGEPMERARVLREQTRRQMVDALDELRGGPGMAERATIG